MTTESQTKMVGRPTLLTLTSTFPRYIDDTQPAFVLELIRHMPGFHHLVLAPNHPLVKADESLAGVEIVRFRYAPLRSWERLAYDGGMAANIRRNPALFLLLPFFLLSLSVHIVLLVRRHDVRLVHAHWMIPQGFCMALSKRFLGRWAPRVLLTSHGGDAFTFESGVGRWCKRIALQSADAHTAVSEQAAQHLHAGLGAPVLPCVIPMGVPDEVREPVHFAERQALCFVGRLVEKKGVADLISAVAMLHDEGVALPVLRIAGTGPLEAALREQVKSAGLNGQVEFLGWQTRDQVRELMRGALAVLVPSIVARSGDQEGQPLVTPEALICGTPVIAYRYPALAEVERLTGGIGVPTENTPDALAAVIRAHLAAPEILQNAIDRAAVRAAFAWPAVGARHAEILRGLLDAP